MWEFQSEFLCKNSTGRFLETEGTYIFGILIKKMNDCGIPKLLSEFWLEKQMCLPSNLQYEQRAQSIQKAILGWPEPK
jgi:hypothetical protein